MTGSGRITFLDNVYFGNRSLPKVPLIARTENIEGMVSTIATTPQQFTGAVGVDGIYTAGGDAQVWRHNGAGQSTLVASFPPGRILGCALDGPTLYVTRDESGYIWKVNTLTGEKTQWAAVGATALALARDRQSLFAVALDGTVGEINLTSGQLTERGSIGHAGAIGIAYDPKNGGAVYVSTHQLLAGGATPAVYKKDLTTGATTTVIAPGPDIGNIWGCALGAKGVYLYLGSFSGDGRVWRWDTRTNDRPVLLAGAVTQGRVDGLGSAARLGNPTPFFGDGRLFAVHGLPEGGVREIQ